MVINMTSIFSEAYSSSFFWSRPDQASVQASPSLEDSFELERLSGSVVRTVRLCASRLFLIRTGEIPENQFLEGEAEVSCMTLEPYILQEKLGFVLRVGDCSETFISNDHRKVQTWIGTLKALCICRDFELDFDILEFLGKGSLSEVFLVAEKPSGTRFAAKIIEKSKLISKNHIKGILREVTILRRLNHPNVVKIVRVYEDNEKVYLVLEHIKGESLLKKLERDQRFAEEHALTITKLVLEVLDYLSSEQVVHRDIKPENILLNETGDSVTLIDFGLAVEVQDDTMQTCGSPGYVAPEILCKRGCSTKTDVFSAGVLLYVMLSGQMPFGTKDQRTIIQRNRMGLVSFPKEFWHHVSANSVNLVIEMMNVDTWARPDAKEALKSLLISPSTAPSSPFIEEIISEPPPFNLDAVDFRIPTREMHSKKIMRSLKEIDDSISTLPRRNSIPKTSVFVLDASVLRKASSSQFS